jgi:hypothetical protein
MLDIFLNKAFTWLRAKAQSRHSQYSRYMFCGIASDKSEIPLSGIGKPKSVFTSAPMPTKFES